MQQYLSLFTKPFLTNAWPTLWRVLVGALMVGHGGDKLFNGLDSFVAEVVAKGWPLPELQAFIAVFIEFAGGVCLVVGLFTRPAALAIAIQFFIITAIWAYDGPFFQRQEKPMLYMLLSLYIFFMGPGLWSVDHFLFRKQHQDAQPENIASDADLSDGTR